MPRLLQRQLNNFFFPALLAIALLSNALPASAQTPNATIRPIVPNQSNVGGTVSNPNLPTVDSTLGNSLKNDNSIAGGGNISQVPTTPDINPIHNTTQSQGGSAQDQNTFGSTPSTNASSGSSNSNVDLPDCGTSITICLADVVYVVTVGLTAPFAYTGAYFLNLAIPLSLSSFTYSLQFITTGWTVSRDIANMAFLFVLIYLAFVIMLRAETSGTTQTLAWVIVIALVVNFSFFGTRLVIDMGNIFATQIYNAIASNTGQSVTTTTQSGNGSSSTNHVDITNNIMAAVGVQGLFNWGNVNSLFQSLGNQSSWSRLISVSVLFIGVAIIMVMLGFSFFVAGINFLSRIIVLWMLIIVSPLALVSYVIPGQKHRLGKWWDSLLHNALYPVVFLFVLLFLEIFATGIGASGLGGQIGLTNLVTNPNTAGGILGLGAQIAGIGIVLFFVIKFFQLALGFADEFKVESSKGANKFGGWMRDRYLGGLARAGGVANKYVGPGAAAGWADNRLQNSRIGNTALGYELRRYVTKPIANKQVGGAESNVQLIERQRRERSEKERNRNAIENRRLADVLANGGKLESKELEKLLALSSHELAGLSDRRDPKGDPQRAERIKAIVDTHQYTKSAPDAERELRAFQKNQDFSEKEREIITEALERDRQKWLQEVAAKPAAGQGPTREELRANAEALFRQPQAGTAPARAPILQGDSTIRAATGTIRPTQSTPAQPTFTQMVDNSTVLKALRSMQDSNNEAAENAASQAETQLHLQADIAKNTKDSAKKANDLLWRVPSAVQQGGATVARGIREALAGAPARSVSSGPQQDNEPPRTPPAAPAAARPVPPAPSAPPRPQPIREAAE